MLYCNKVKPSFDVPRKVEGRVLRAVAGKDSETVLVVFELLAYSTYLLRFHISVIFIVYTSLFLVCWFCRKVIIMIVHFT